MTMLLFTRLQLISTWLIVQTTTSLEGQVTYTEHPTTTAHQVFTALQSDSTVSKALDASTKESVTARSPDVASQVDQQWRYQPATLVLDTSSATLATHNHIASLETFKVASENSSTGNQQQASLQSHKSSKEQRASLISQTSSSGHTSTTAPENSSHEEQIPTPSSTAGVHGTAVPSTLSTPQYGMTNVVQSLPLHPQNFSTEQSKTVESQLNPSPQNASLIAGEPLSSVDQVNLTQEQQNTTSYGQPWPTTSTPHQGFFNQIPSLRPQNTSIGQKISSLDQSVASLRNQNTISLAQNTSFGQPITLTSFRGSPSELQSSLSQNSYPSRILSPVVQLHSTLVQKNSTSLVQNSTQYGQPIAVTPLKSSSANIPSLTLQNNSTTQPSSVADQVTSAQKLHNNTELQSSISKNSYPSRTLSPVVQLHSTLVQKNSTSLVQNSTQYSQPITVTPIKGSSANIPSLKLQNNSTTQPSSVVDQVTSAQELHNNASLTQSKYHEQSVNSYESAPAKVQTMVSSNSSSLQSLLSVEKLTLPIQKQNFTFLVQNGSNGQPTTVSSHTTSFAQLSSRKPQNSILEQTKTYEPYVNSTPKLLSLPSMFQSDSAGQLATTSTWPYSTIKIASLITKDNYTEQLLSITHQGNITYKQQPTSQIYSGKPTTDLFDVGSKVQNATLIPYSGNTEQISTSASQQNLSIKLSSLILQGNSAEQPSSPVNQTKSAVKLLSQDSPFSLKPTSAESQANSFVQLTIFIPQNSSILTEIPPSALPLANLTVEQKFTTALQPTNLVSQKYSGEQLMTVSDSVQSNPLRTTLAHKHTVEQNSSIIHQDNSTILRPPNKNSSRLFATPVLVVNSTLQQKLTPTSTLDDESTPKPSTLLPEISSSEQKFKTTKLSVHSSLQERNSTNFTVQTTATSSQFYSTQRSTAITLPLLRKGKKFVEQRGRKTYRILSCCSNRL